MFRPVVFYSLHHFSLDISGVSFELTYLGVAEVHLGVLRLEFLEDVGLALIIRGGEAHLLLALVVHHLLDHAARLAVEVGQLAVLGLDLGHIDLGGARDHVGPPLHLVCLVQVDLDRLRPVGRCRQGPGRILGMDCVREVALERMGQSLLLGRVCTVLTMPRRAAWWEFRGIQCRQTGGMRERGREGGGNRIRRRWAPGL